MPGDRTHFMAAENPGADDIRRWCGAAEKTVRLDINCLNYPVLSFRVTDELPESDQASAET